MDEDLDGVSVSLQTVGKVAPMIAAQQSKTGCQDSEVVSLILPRMCCATFAKLLRKSLSNGTDTIGCIYIKVPAFQRPKPASLGKLVLLDSSPLLSLQNVPFSFFLLASPSVK